MSADESITSLSEAVAALGALPVPVGPEPQRVCSLCQTVKPDGAAMRDHVLNVHPDEFCGLYHEQPCRHGAVVPEPLSAEREAEIREWVEAMGRKKDIRYYGSWQQHGELLGEIDRLRTQVAELLAERHVTNEALDDAVQALRANAELALPWAHVMPDGDLGGFLDDLVSAALNRWRTDPDGPVPDRVTLADIERVCREWRTPGVGYRSDPEPEAVPDAVTAVFSPVASLREPEGEHWAAVHHSYRVPRDLPEMGGTQ